MRRDPTFTIYTGPMFGSKTTKLLGSIDRFTRQGLSVVAFKPKIDARYSESEICTHNGGKYEALSVSNSQQMRDCIDDLIHRNACDVIAVDELFMIDGAGELLIDYFKNNGLHIIVASINLDSNAMPFKEIKDVMPWGTHIEICPAVCPVSGKDAYYTMAKFDFDHNEGPVIGGKELYEPRCYENHPWFNRYKL